VRTNRGASAARELADELVLFRLRSLAIFGGCTEEQLRLVAARSVERRFVAEDVVVREGAPVRDVPVILDGYASAEVGGEPVIVLGAGAVVGGSEALDGALFPATVVAQTPVVVTRVIAAPDFAGLVATVPPLAMGLIRQLGGRTRTVLDELRCARQGSVTPGVGSTSPLGSRRPAGATARPRLGRRPATT